METQTTNKYLRIDSIEQLKEEAKNGADFFILLKYGCRSSKYIIFESGMFTVFNDMDGSDQELTDDGIMNESNIGAAITNKAFFKFLD